VAAPTMVASFASPGSPACPKASTSSKNAAPRTSPHGGGRQNAGLTGTQRPRGKYGDGASRGHGEYPVGQPVDGEVDERQDDAGRPERTRPATAVVG